MTLTKLKITPHLWFDKEALEAAQYYCSIFPGSEIAHVTTLRDTPSGDCELVSFRLSGQSFMAISAGPLFRFNESISFMVHCDTQEEIDHYWSRLSAVPEAEQCGWLKDRYGLSWQILPTVMDEMMQDPERLPRVMQAVLLMKKPDLETLAAAYRGE